MFYYNIGVNIFDITVLLFDLLADAVEQFICFFRSEFLDELFGFACK